MSLANKLGKKGQTLSMNEKVIVTVIEEKYNKLLGRIEVILLMDHIVTGTPSRAEVRDFIAKLYNVDPSLVVVKEILSQFGRGSSRAHVHIYESMERLKLLEPKHILRRHGIQV
ncbi:MAG TPA: 30S ribosomal protein S24e [Ignisphaera sp.]|nr:30S ribosomal protein S24e [Ignisphaera sp.]